MRPNSTSGFVAIPGIQTAHGGSTKTYVGVAGYWTYLYRAVDSTGETIDFLLSPKRDAVAAKHFLQMAMWRVGRSDRE